jgi:hypothetical protein
MRPLKNNTLPLSPAVNISLAEIPQISRMDWTSPVLKRASPDQLPLLK